MSLFQAEIDRVKAVRSGVADLLSRMNAEFDDMPVRDARPNDTRFDEMRFKELDAEIRRLDAEIVALEALSEDR